MKGTAKVFKISKWAFLLLFIITIPSIIALFNPGFFPTHDYIYIARIYQMAQALSDGQFPVRWVEGFRYGDPTYNFYAPFPYYLGALISYLGFSFLATTKILFGLSFFLSVVTMYLLIKELFGRKLALAASALYLYAPYRSLDVYV